MVAVRTKVSRGNTGGEHRGGTPLRARCSPWIRLRRGFCPGRRTRLARGGRAGQLQIVVQVAARRPRAALCAARLVEPLPERSPTAIPWRERPPEMAGWPAKPAASAVVAHAAAERVLAPRDSAVSRVETTANSTRDLRENLWISRRSFHSDPGFGFRTADAARGAATKGGGWRTSGALSCQSITMIGEPVSASVPLASLSTPTTCELRSRAPSAAFRAAHEATYAASLLERGREQPPDFAALAVPRPARGLLTPRCPRRNVRGFSL